MVRRKSSIMLNIIVPSPAELEVSNNENSINMYEECVQTERAPIVANASVAKEQDETVEPLVSLAQQFRDKLELLASATI